MAKHKHKSFSLNFGIFHGHVLCVVSNDWTKSLEIEKARLKKEKQIGWLWFCDQIQESISDNKVYGMAMMRDGEHGIYFGLFMREFDFNNTEHHVVLAHECLHLCQYHLVDFIDRNIEHEAEAYTHSHLMSQFYNQIRK